MLRSTAGVKSLLHERLQLQTPVETHERKVSEKAAAAFFGDVATGANSKVFERAQQHAGQMEWIQEILTLKGENSSKMELGKKLGFEKTTIILQKDLFTTPL